MAPSPAILVAYATSTGTTREIAERIATTLKATTSWPVDCKPVSEIPSLHEKLHKSPPPPPPPSPAAESHSIPSINPLTALITPEQPPVEYKAIIIGSSIHAGRWISPGRTFLSQNHDFFVGKCCTPTPTPAHKGWFSLPFFGGTHNQQPPPTSQPEPEPSSTPSTQPQPPPPKIYAFSVGMPGNDEALLAEQKSVEAALRKSLGQREEGKEVLTSHVLFRGQWSPQQLDILAPFIGKIVRWVVPKDHKILKGDDERDWEGIEKWAGGVGKEVVGKGNEGE